MWKVLTLTSQMALHGAYSHDMRIFGGLLISRWHWRWQSSMGVTEGRVLQVGWPAKQRWGVKTKVAHASSPGVIAGRHGFGEQG